MKRDTLILKRFCPICGCDKGKKLLDLDFKNCEGVPLPEHYDVVICNECGFAFSNMQADQRNFNDYYSQYNVYEEAEALRAEDSTYEPRLLYSIDLISKFLKKDAAIVDIGCGGGELLLALKRAGFLNIVGIDPGKNSIQHLEKLGIKGKLGNVFDKYSGQKYDLAVSTAVIEHIYDLNGYVENLKQYLRRDGLVMINAPAVEGFPEYICPLPNYFNQEHINFFDNVSLDNLMAIHGFKRINDIKILIDDKEQQLINIYKLTQEDCHIVRDDIAETCVEEYLKKYHVLQDKMNKYIQNIIDEKKKIVVFGTGAYAKQLIKKFPELKENIIGFVDNNKAKQGNILLGKKIESPEMLMDISDDIDVLICSMKNSSEITEQIKKMNVKNNVICGCS